MCSRELFYKFLIVFMIMMEVVLNKFIKYLSPQSVGFSGKWELTQELIKSVVPPKAVGSYVKLNCDQGFHLPSSKYACLTLVL